MNASRTTRVRVLEVLEGAVKQFRTREELHPLRVPREPITFDTVMIQALGEDGPRFDAGTLRSRTLLHLEWEDGSAWDLWVIVLPSGLKLYCDSGEEEARILASGGRNLGDQSDRLFLERLAASGGDDFGIEMSGGAPTLVRSSIADRGFLADVFVELFEGTAVEPSIGHGQGADLASVAHHQEGHDFRAGVTEWLERVMR